MNATTSAPRGLKTLALLSVFALLVVLTVNTLANALPLNGVNTGQLSDEIPNLFVPAGLTFSIWGLIYLLLVLHAAAVVREAWKPGSPLAWDRTDAWLFILNMVANTAWIFAWQWRLVPLSMSIMLVLLGSLIAQEGRSQRKLGQGGALEDASRARRFLLTVPLRVYLGWISVATIANATALLVKLGWDGFGLDPRLWTVLVIAAGLVVALGFSLWKREAAAPLVIVWAYLGIALKRTSLDAAYSAPVWIAAALSAILILLSVAYAALGSRSGKARRA